MKRIVATEKLQELNLPSESEFFAPLRSRNELVPLTFDLLDRRHCVPISRHGTIFCGTSGTVKFVSADTNRLKYLRYVDCSYRTTNKAIKEACHELGSNEGQLEAIQRKG